MKTTSILTFVFVSATVLGGTGFLCGTATFGQQRFVPRPSTNVAPPLVLPAAAANPLRDERGTAGPIPVSTQVRESSVTPVRQTAVSSDSQLVFADRSVSQNAPPPSIPSPSYATLPPNSAPVSVPNSPPTTTPIQIEYDPQHEVDAAAMPPRPTLSIGDITPNSDDSDSAPPLRTARVPNVAIQSSPFANPPAPAEMLPQPPLQPLPFLSHPLPLPASPQTTPLTTLLLDDTASFTARENRSVSVHSVEGTGTPGGKNLEGLQAAQVSVEKILPQELIVDQPVVFRTVIRNTGTIAVRDVLVVDRIPSGAKLVTTVPEATVAPNGQLRWDVGLIEVKQERIIEMTIIPLREGEIGSVAQVSYTAEASAKAVATQPMLQLEVKKPETAILGQPITFEIAISNPGSGVAKNVVLQENVPEGLVHEKGSELLLRVGDFKPKEQRRFSLTMTSTRSGTISNFMFVRGDHNLYAEDKSFIEVLAPALELQIAGSKTRYLDRRAVYQLSVSNPGTATAQGIDLVLHLPTGLKFDSTNQSGVYDSQSHTVHWALASLPNNGAGQIELVTIPVKTGDYRLRFVGEGESGLKTETSHEIAIDGLAATSFEVKCVTDPVELGKNAIYEIRVINRGTKTATNIAVTSQLSSGMTFVEAAPIGASEMDGTIQFRNLPSLEPREERIFKIAAMCDAPGDHRVRVQLTADDLGAPITKEESTRVLEDR